MNLMLAGRSDRATDRDAFRARVSWVPAHAQEVAMNQRAYVIGIVAVVASATAGFWWWSTWSRQPSDARPPAVVASPPPQAASDPVEPSIRHPVGSTDTSEAAAVAASAADADAILSAAITELLGQQAVLSMLQLDGFARRVVATVDNLGRSHAAPRLWPVNPTPGRITVAQGSEGTVIAAANHARYTAFVSLVDAVDAARAVALYKRFYPLFQREYEALGFPRGYFNDRLVDVIDELLATPEPKGPLAVRLTEVKGPIQPVRPWVLYEYADPALESRSAGQKIMLRMGVDYQRRLKAKLKEIRALLTGAG